MLHLGNRLRCAALGLGVLFAGGANVFAAEFPLQNAEAKHYAEWPSYSEGPTWAKGVVYFCGGALVRVDKPHAARKWLDISPAGTYLLSDGRMLIVDNKNKAVLVMLPNEEVHVLADKDEAGAPLRGLNDVTVDGAGNLYWTDPTGSGAKSLTGRVYRMTPAGKVEKILNGLAFPNGLDVDPASKYLYVIESQTQKVLRYALPATGAAFGAAETFYELGGAGGDGCAFDADGRIYVADFHQKDIGFGRITVLADIEGRAKLLGHVAVPAKQVSNVSFGGAKHDELFISTGTPGGVFHFAGTPTKGFAGQPGADWPKLRKLELAPVPESSAPTK